MPRSLSFYLTECYSLHSILTLYLPRSPSGCLTACYSLLSSTAVSTPSYMEHITTKILGLWVNQVLVQGKSLHDNILVIFKQKEDSFLVSPSRRVYPISQLGVCQSETIWPTNDSIVTPGWHYRSTFNENIVTSCFTWHSVLVNGVYYCPRLMHKG
jgi:hypothetical protein